MSFEYAVSLSGLDTNSLSVSKLINFDCNNLVLDTRCPLDSIFWSLFVSPWWNCINYKTWIHCMTFWNGFGIKSAFQKIHTIRRESPVNQLIFFQAVDTTQNCLYFTEMTQNCKIKCTLCDQQVHKDDKYQSFKVLNDIISISPISLTSSPVTQIFLNIPRNFHFLSLILIFSLSSIVWGVPKNQPQNTVEPVWTVRQVI